MRTLHSSVPLPKQWDPLLKEFSMAYVGDVCVTDGSKLKAKVLVFNKQREMVSFWRRRLCRDPLGMGCLGVTSALSVEKYTFHKGEKERHFTIVDPVYFSVIGLLRQHLTTEIITHESVHAAHSYATRTGNRNKWPGAIDMEEENICYPAGIIAAKITMALQTARLI